MKLIGKSLAAIGISAALAVPSLASAPGSRTTQFIVLDAPGAGTATGQGTFAYVVNSSSVVTGYFTDSHNDSHGFTWADGTFTTFDIDGALSETASYWVNDRGASVGVYKDSHTGVIQGFLRTGAGKISTFDGAGSGSTGTVANGVNSKSQVVGDYFDANQALHGFLRAKDGALTPIDAPEAGSGPNQGTTGLSINGDGTITGQYFDANNFFHGYVRASSGSITQFDAPSATNGTSPVCINKKGQVAGGFIDGKHVNHGFVRSSRGKFSVIDAPDAAQTSRRGTYGSCINDHGELTGYYTDSKDVFHGFVRSKSGSIEEFDAPGAGTTVDLGTYPFDINGDGAIAGYFRDKNHVVHGFLRLP